jgi:hypothetical protein
MEKGKISSQIGSRNYGEEIFPFSIISLLSSNLEIMEKGKISAQIGPRNYGEEIFPFSIISRSDLRNVRSPIQWMMSDISPGIGRKMLEVDQSLPFCAEVKYSTVYSVASQRGAVFNYLGTRGIFTFIFLNYFQYLSRNFQF